MDYDQVILRLFHQLDEDQQEIFISALKKAAAKDPKYQALMRFNENRSLPPLGAASAEAAGSEPLSSHP